jgi:predicted membrane protein
MKCPLTPKCGHVICILSHRNKLKILKIICISSYWEIYMLTGFSILYKKFEVFNKGVLLHDFVQYTFILELKGGELNTGREQEIGC